MRLVAVSAPRTRVLKRAVIVLDAQALEAFFVGEPAMPTVTRIFGSGEPVTIAAINLGETADRMIRVHGADPFRVAGDIAECGIHITGLDSDLVLVAASLRAAHYHRVRRPVSLADCVAAALSLDRVARLATSDPALLDLVVDEGGLVEPLPGSDGSIHNPMNRQS